MTRASSPAHAPTHSQSSGGSNGSDSVAKGAHSGAGTAPVGPGPLSGGAAPTTRPHGPTSLGLLRIQWDYPVYTGGPLSNSDGARTGALPAAEALRFIARDDPRPLLVVRECRRCNRTDRALLTPGIDNERTILLSRWFHCVKLPPDVSQHEHALHALFPRDDAEHLFVCAADGSGRVALEADTSRSELWATMSAAIAKANSADPAPAYKQLAALVDGFDLVDTKLIDLQERRSRLLESGRLDADALKKLDEQIADLRAQLARDLERAQRLSQAAAPARPAGG
jgi:hypothetical protein